MTDGHLRFFCSVTACSSIQAEALFCTVRVAIVAMRVTVTSYTIDSVCKSGALYLRFKTCRYCVCGLPGFVSTTQNVTVLSKRKIKAHFLQNAVFSAFNGQDLLTLNKSIPMNAKSK